MCRSSIGWSDTHHPLISRNHMDSSNPTASANVGRYQTGTFKNPSVLPTRATRKTTRFSVRDAKYNAAGAMHRVAWALQNSKGTGQKCEKPWENLWFCSGEDRNRTFRCFSNVFGCFERPLPWNRKEQGGASMENEGSPLTSRSLQAIMYLHWSTIGIDCSVE